MRSLPFHLVLTGTFLLTLTSQAQVVKHGTSHATAHPIYGSAPVEPSGPMPLLAPVFLQTDQVDSSLSVVNGVSLDTPGFVTLRDMPGNVVIRKAFTFRAHSSTIVTTTSLLAEAKSIIHSGSLTVEQDPSVKGPALLGQLSMTLHVGSQAAFLEEELGMPTMHGSQTLRGVASETTNSPLIAVTSNSEASQTITATCIGENTSTTIELPSNGTAVVRACSWEAMHDNDLGLASALLQEKQSQSKNHAIQLTTDAVPGAFYAFGFALNGTITHAQLQPLDFYDPGQAFSTKTVYVGVPVGTHKLLPDGTYAPTITLANFSLQPRTAEVLFADSSGTKPKVTSVAHVSLPALSTKTVQLSGITGTGIQNTITVSSDGKPGEVQVHLFAGQSGTARRVEMLAKDAKDDRNGGNHPWSTANGDQSTLLLHNLTATSQTFQVQISGSGSSWTDPITLVPSETKSVSINDLIANQTKDHAGHALPSTLTSGEVLWYTPTGASGLGRLMVTNITSGLARSYSCPTYQGMCSASFGSQNFLDAVYNTDSFYSAVVVETCTEYSPNSCYQSSPSGYTSPSSTQWSGNYSSYNNTISTSPSSLGLHSTTSGSFSISAMAEYGGCESGSMGGGGTADDYTPIITGLDPSEWVPGTTQAVIFTGQYFGANPGLTFSPGSGISYIVTSSNDSQIVANVTVAAGTPNEDVNVGIVSNGSGGAGFTAGSSGNSPNSSPVYASVLAPFGSQEVTIIAWIDGSAPDLDLSQTSGVNSTLVGSLNNYCTAELGAWITGYAKDVNTQADRDYANKFLIAHTANGRPPIDTVAQVMNATARDAIYNTGDFRLFNNWGGYSRGMFKVGSTPDPCHSIISSTMAFFGGSGQASHNMGYHGTSPSGNKYQVAEGRAGKIGQRGSVTINQRSVPWIYSVSAFDPSGHPVSFGHDHASFLTYYVYIDGYFHPELTSTQSNIHDFFLNYLESNENDWNSVP